MSRKTVCQKQPLFRERDQDKNPTLLPASSFYIHESEMTGQTLFVLLLQTVFAPEMLLPQCQEISPCELDILGG